MKFGVLWMLENYTKFLPNHKYCSVQFLIIEIDEFKKRENTD